MTFLRTNMTVRWRNYDLKKIGWTLHMTTFNAKLCIFLVNVICLKLNLNLGDFENLTVRT